MDLVIYHGDCYDGFTAAWVASRAMPGCELHAGKYGEPPPDVRGRRVFIVDFSYPRDVMIRMEREALSLLVLDHHKTAEEACRGLYFCIFDMDRSGAGMGWDHWFPGKPRPWLVDRVEDRDLWRFRFDDTKQIHALVAATPMTLDNWYALDALTIDDARERGSAILGYIDTSISKAVQESRVIRWGEGVGDPGLCVAALNVTYQNASETADVMLKRHPEADFSMSYFQRRDGRWQYSLRSRTNFDVSAVAKQFGGGGHAQAAGFDTHELLGFLQPRCAMKEPQ